MPTEEDTPALILASGSAVRANLLRGTGLPFEIVPADVDEAVLKQGFGGTPGDLALALAAAKAERVASARRHGLVIGADQVLSCDGRLFDKPANLDEARHNLIFFRGKTHTLHNGIALFRDGAPWKSFTADATLTMRAFSDSFLDAYLADVGDRVLSSVGCYQLEGPGVQLFEEIHGDYFTVLGLPLLPLLAALREIGIAAT